MQVVAQQFLPGGFPLCLYGIQNSYQVHGSTRQQLLRLRQLSFLGAEISLSPANSMDSFSANPRLSANGNQTSRTEGSERDETIQERPQLALILEMEDHERRREAIRKQRSSRRPISIYADEDCALTGGNMDRLHNLIEEVMGDPTFKQNLYSSIRHHACAKAA